MEVLYDDKRIDKSVALKELIKIKEFDRLKELFERRTIRLTKNTALDCIAECVKVNEIDFIEFILKNIV